MAKGRAYGHRCTVTWGVYMQVQVFRSVCRCEGMCVAKLEREAGVKSACRMSVCLQVRVLQRNACACAWTYMCESTGESCAKVDSIVH